ncbi:MAG: HIRAN domain-containing protein [Coriobacteriales bacterium]|nr:HIRAN domain-containing protein [Coriobacteriales bacterium]
MVCQYCHTKFFPDSFIYQPERTFLSCNLAGFEHWGGLQVFHRLQIGTQLWLHAEPHNPYDPQAVAVYYQNIKIGYIPRKHNAPISALAKMGYLNMLGVFITKIAPNQHPERQIGLTIKTRNANPVLFETAKQL